MRLLWALPLGILAACLFALQFVASVALRDSAPAGSWVHLLPASFALGIEHLDPALPLTPGLRMVLARRALERGDLADARAYVERMGFSSDRLDLEGRLAEAAGDDAAAVRAYLAADDLDDVERHVQLLAGARKFDAALALQHAVVERLSGDRTQTGALAQAFYELGQLDESDAYSLWIRSQARRDAEARAMEAYAHAVALAPFSERYLIAYGNQLLNLNRVGDAERIFAHAREVDPASAEPLVGLGEAALRRGDAAASRAFLERARTIDPRDAAVLRLAHALGA